MHKLLPLQAALLSLVIPASAWAGTEPLRLEPQTLAIASQDVSVRLPRGYRLEFVTALDSPRLINFAPNGEMFIGSKAGTIYRLRPPYATATKFAEVGGYPHSVAFRPGEILVAKTEGVYRAPYQPGQAQLDLSEFKMLAPLPGGGGHTSRTVSVGPDRRIYLALGIQGNCSDQYIGAGYSFDDQRGGVMVLREEGRPQWQPYASGLRNPVGIAWQPKTNTLYASNNGPDHSGYDAPPEYFSRLMPNSFHGMPWFQVSGTGVERDTCVNSRPPRPIAEVSLPVATFPARSAPMGVAFIPDKGLEASWHGDALVAIHGSWGTKPSGGASGDPATRRPPKIALVRFDAGKAVRVDDFLTGFQVASGERWARPIGVAVAPDGAIYFTSDSGIEGLYRVRRQ